MRNIGEDVTIIENEYRITSYTDGIAFSVFMADVPQIFKDKAVELIIELTKNRIQKKIIADAELLISHNEHMEKCSYNVIAYICSEKTETESARYEIVPGTTDYAELKKYALQQLSNHLFS